ALLRRRARRLPEGLHDLLARRVAAQGRRRRSPIGAEIERGGVAALSTQDLPGAYDLLLSGQRAVERHQGAVAWGANRKMYRRSPCRQLRRAPYGSPHRNLALLESPPQARR